MIIALARWTLIALAILLSPIWGLWLAGRAYQAQIGTDLLSWSPLATCVLVTTRRA